MDYDDFKDELRRTRTGIMVRSRHMTLPGFKSQTVFDVARFFIAEVQRNSIQVRATSVSFHFLMATFPTLLVLFTIIPYLPIAGLKEGLLNFVYQLLPSNGYEFVYKTAEDIVMREHGGLLSVGILLSLYYTSRGVVGILNAFDKAYPSFYRRKFVRKTLVSFKVSFLLIILVMASIGVIVFGQWVLPLVLNYFEMTSRFTLNAVVVLRWVALVALLYVGFSLIYYYGPAIRQRWSFFTAGSTLATILSLIASLLFSFIINHFGQLNKLYGSIGTLIIMMLWIYWNAMILLVGFELNAAIELNRIAKVEQGLDPDDDDD